MKFISLQLFNLDFLYLSFAVFARLRQFFGTNPAQIWTIRLRSISTWTKSWEEKTSLRII